MEASGFEKRRTGNKFDNSCIIKTVKHPSSVIIWDATTINRAILLHFVEKTLRQEEEFWGQSHCHILRKSDFGLFRLLLYKMTRHATPRNPLKIMIEKNPFTSIAREFP